MHNAASGTNEPLISAFASTSWVVPPPLPVTRHRLQFSGRAGEYFRIWIVNLALSIVTLGIYSAWAKVRTRRYFYANTRLADSSFEYLAQPMQILKGRLIAYSVVLALWLSAHFQVLIVYFPLLALVLLLLPWVIYRTLAFRARYTAWRGLRFRFVESVSDAYVNYLFRPLVLPFTLYLMYPWVHMHQHDYMVADHRFGGKRFTFADNCNGYIVPYVIAAALGVTLYVGFIAIFIAVMASAMQHSGVPTSSPPKMPAMPPMMILAMAIAYLMLLSLPVFLRTRYSNVMWQHTRLGLHAFECTLRARDVLWLYFSNALVILLTLGLAVPWAQIRMARYRAEKFVLVAGDDLDNFVAEAAHTEGAAGAELLGALDMDFDIGL